MEDVIYKSYSINKDDVQESGEFSGYGSVFGVIDAYGDVIEKGAFAESISGYRATGRMPAMLASHGFDSMWPVGVYKEVNEDDHGLFLRGALALKTPMGSEAFELMKMGALSGLSIGCRLLKDGYKWTELNGQKVRSIHKLDLMEVSIVTFPANSQARVGMVKSTKRQIEDTLRVQCGLSCREVRRAVEAIGVRDEQDGIEDVIANLDKHQKGIASHG